MCLIIPLVCQFIFIASYNSLLVKAEHLADEEYHEKVILARVHWLNALVSTLVATGLAREKSHAQILSPIYKGCKDLIRDECSQLQVLFEDRSDQQKTLLQACKHIAEVETQLDRGETNSELINLDSLLPLMKQLFDERRQLMVTETHQYQGNEESNPSYRSELKGLLLGMAALDTVIAIVLFQLFTKGITDRLSVLEENTTRLAKHEELKTQVSGSDEVARLDGAFRKMAADLKEAEERKQEMVSMITHDLKSPLTAVAGALELIKEGVEPNSPDGAMLLERADRNLQSLMRMITDFLDAERLESGMMAVTMTSFDIKEAIDESVDSLKSWADQRKIELKVDAAGGIEVSADKYMISRLMDNLIGNALKYSPEGSTITITAKDLGSECEVVVSDQGPGIRPEYLSKVFERYQQADPTHVRKGTGFGLAICKIIMEAHHGQIGVTSEPGQGSRFWFKLPK